MATVAKEVTIRIKGHRVDLEKLAAMPPHLWVFLGQNTNSHRLTLKEAQELRDSLNDVLDAWEDLDKN